MTECIEYHPLFVKQFWIYLITLWMVGHPFVNSIILKNMCLVGSSSHLSKVGSILISADDIPLDNVNSYTYLAIVINNRFSWTDHFDYIRIYYLW